MTTFVIGALLLTVAALFILLQPFRRRPASADFSRTQLNAAIYRDEMADLERDLSEGALSEEDYAQAREELQRRLIEDSSTDNPTAGSAVAAQTAHRATPIALALALPLAAAALYLLLGNPAAINPPPPAQEMTAEDIDRMVSSLAAKLKQEPGNLQGWTMLARSYKAMGRLPEAIQAYEKASSLAAGDADLLLDYADTLAVENRGFTEQVKQLIDQALAIDPVHPQGLWLRGTAYYSSADYAKAITDWEKLLSVLPPESENAQVVRANIDEVKQLQAQASQKTDKPDR
jgi:cytochrome c-type biogenesis protein CcmH